MRGLLLPLGIVALAASLVAGNARHLIGHERSVRKKDLEFLPDPAVARVLACGHANSASRLRWIDAFAYFQLQLDRKDDRVAGGGSGFERLFDLLIGLDPRFEPYYEHAALCLGGIVGRHQQELAYLQRGVLELPASTSLRRSVASVLVTYFGWDRHQPGNLDALLTEWAEAEVEPGAKASVWFWKANLARRTGGLEQIPYWLDRLRGTGPGTPLRAFIEAIVREQLARYAVGELQAIADERRAAGEAVATIGDLIDPQRIAARRSDAALGPFVVADGTIAVRADPYGYPYVLERGRVRSPGLEYAGFGKQVAVLDQRLRRRAEEGGHWPEDLAAILAAEPVLREPPLDARVAYRDRRLIAEIPEPPGRPLVLP
jgi:hypothetical protein